MTEKVPGPTGRLRVRRGWRGALVLQIEVNAGMLPEVGTRGGKLIPYAFWRDARIEDLTPDILARFEDAPRPQALPPPADRVTTFR